MKTTKESAAEQALAVLTTALDETPAIREKLASAADSITWVAQEAGKGLHAVSLRGSVNVVEECARSLDKLLGAMDGAHRALYAERRAQQ